jgi:Arc/MetJ family transcription regulator
MRHTVVIDDELLRETTKALGTTTIRETIEAALREALRTRKLQELRALLGNIDMDVTDEELEQWRADD